MCAQYTFYDKQITAYISRALADLYSSVGRSLLFPVVVYGSRSDVEGVTFLVSPLYSSS